MKAVRCPVCDSSGKYEKKQCHGCSGKGWVEVRESYPYVTPCPHIEPWYPQPEPWYPRDYITWTNATGDTLEITSVT